MEIIIRKLTSRKFLLALVGVATGLAMVFGLTGEDVNRTVSTISGILTALGSITVYNIAESNVDANSVANKNEED